MNVKTGDVVYVDLPNNIGSQQGGERYAVVVSNNIGNYFSPTVEILPATTQRKNSRQPTHAHFAAGECGLHKDTVFSAESKWIINKFQIKKIVGHMNEEQMTRIAKAIVYQTPIVIYAIENGILSETQFKNILKMT